MNKKFYVTTAIDYANASPHIGHALEKIQADVLVRYHRLLGEDTFYLTGTDENAQKNVLAAEEAKKPVGEFIDENVAVFQEMVKLLNISNNYFIRTANKEIHWPGVKKLWEACKNSGDIYKKSYTGLYCLGCEAFLTEKDLENGLCPEHFKEPEKISEENYFFRLSKYQKKIKGIIEKDELRIVPEKRKKEILSFLDSGLEDFSISRPKERTKGWGVPVPGDESQTIYVWYDALSNYITALGYGTGNETLFEKFWPADVHVIGKGITRFHAVYWPAMLMSAGVPLPKTIFVHDYLTVNGQKISKTLGNIIDPISLVKKYGTDPVRYFFLREFSPFQDGDFTYERFEERYNSDLAKGLGNLVSRVMTMADKFFEGKEIKVDSEIDIDFQKISEKTAAKFKQKMEEFRFNEALTEIWALISYCDRYIEENKVWETKNERPLKNLLFALFQVAFLSQPFIPETSVEIEKRLGANLKDKPRRFKIQKGESLFPRL